MKKVLSGNFLRLIIAFLLMTLPGTLCLASRFMSDLSVFLKVSLGFLITAALALLVSDMFLLLRNKNRHDESDNYMLTGSLPTRHPARGDDSR
jgi:hypothetical protein